MIRRPPRSTSTDVRFPVTTLFRAAVLSRYKVADKVSAGSSLKFCLVASGRADLYPRLGRTMEWDTAAGHAVLLAAGGQVYTLEGEPLDYRSEEHTSDLQSLMRISYAVFCLKKKNKMENTKVRNRRKMQ